MEGNIKLNELIEFLENMPDYPVGINYNTDYYEYPIGIRFQGSYFAYIINGDTELTSKELLNRINKKIEELEVTWTNNITLFARGPKVKGLENRVYAVTSLDPIYNLEPEAEVGDIYCEPLDPELGI